MEKRAKKIPIRDLVQAIEEQMGVGLPELSPGGVASGCGRLGESSWPWQRKPDIRW